ncbi:FKBP-type peptidyl-prolyl cis-trans isomerase [Flavobacterium sp.]|uniref:FKBP-type peptidyl-prolyl cis-trans isomerase n=1 Tax=Flavobacterium sp. TaxID=239 RepID=UPI003C538390
MNKFRFYFILSITTILLFSCSSSDNSYEEVPLRDFQEQFTADNTLIETYLNSHYINITNEPGDQTDQDVVITVIPDGGSQKPIMTYLNNADFPKLLKRDVPLHGITYSIYYLVLREGTGNSPTNVDNVLTSYNGTYLTSDILDTKIITATRFEEIKYPEQMSNLYNVIRGWSEIFPQFKTGTHADGPNGTVVYSDFGAGVIFIPSGLAYYSEGSSNIPSYTPLVFSFKLYELQRMDQDDDGILSINEDLNHDGYMTDYRNTVAYPTAPANLDDTDQDGIPNFLDTDDDGDGYTTKLEISKGTNYLDKNSHP